MKGKGVVEAKGEQLTEPIQAAGIKAGSALALRNLARPPHREPEPPAGRKLPDTAMLVTCLGTRVGFIVPHENSEKDQYHSGKTSYQEVGPHLLLPA